MCDIISVLREGLLFAETETPMRHISYMPLWHTLLNKNMKKEDLRIAAGLTTNMIANMGKNKGISMESWQRSVMRSNVISRMFLN